MGEQEITGDVVPSPSIPKTRAYQQEMLQESLRRNIIIALDTGSGKTHIAVLRMKIEAEREATKISWFVAPTVALCEQQKNVIQSALPVAVGLISGAAQPDQWKNAAMWAQVLRTHRIIVSTPQVLLDALRHAYVNLGKDIGLLIFDEAHHAVDNHPYNRIMQEFYLALPPRPVTSTQVDTQVRPVRPAIMGLTASPIYGGNVVRAFDAIESNLDSTIRAPRQNREELAKFVHRPVFKHIFYSRPEEPDLPFSTNLASLCSIIETLEIENDPYVHSLRQQLGKAVPNTPEYNRLDQKLSKCIMKEDSFAHKGLRDFANTAKAILDDLGTWATDWYVWTVIEHAKRAANPFSNIVLNWKNQEKAYLLGILNQVAVTPISLYPDDIVDDSSDKVRALIECLWHEKLEAETHDETYSGILFVQRRDTVLALSELLKYHPFTANMFQVGTLLGTSDSAYRRSFLDITRMILRESQDDTLADFKVGEKTLIVSTSVAEEGIDIQACGSVIRWDPPPNMASWAQSRGRARRQRSTFTLMFERGGAQQKDVLKWEALEREMVALYNDPQRDLMLLSEESPPAEEEDATEFRIESTGALLTLNSAVSHLSHFCAVIPNSAHIDNRPVYDIDPPELPLGWHSLEDRSTRIARPYAGPFGSKVTLPKVLPPELRVFSVEREYSSKDSAHRHVAFKAYHALYVAGLLNEHLLPLTSVVEPQLEEEVKALLQEVEKRSGMANVSIQVDPWGTEDGSPYWWSSELVVDGLPPLCLFTRSQTTRWTEEGPVLHRTGHEPLRVYLRPLGQVHLGGDKLEQARAYTRRLLWCLNGSRMEWDKVDFSYLFAPLADADQAVWETRRSLLAERECLQSDQIFVEADVFGRTFDYPNNLAIIKNRDRFGKPNRFVRWRYEVLSAEEEEAFREFYSKVPDLEIVYPLLVVQPYPPRTNFLVPTGPSTEPHVEPKPLILFPRMSYVVLLSTAEAEYAFLIPSVLRSLSMSLTIDSLREDLFADTPLYTVPRSLLQVAMTAPVSQEHTNYQRLETLGDTVLKFVAGIQLLGEYPLWHEGYLSRKKDHAVSNVRLAKEDIARGLFRWIIRDRMLGKKWAPSYFTKKIKSPPPPPKVDTPKDEDSPKKRPKANQQLQLSTKVLADVVESLIGAAFLHGGYDLGNECAKFFDLGLKWQPLQYRIDSMLARVEDHPDLPVQLFDVEHMLGYTFTHKLLLVEALTHASYEQDLGTVSYERLEFLGDSVLDMVVTNYLYHAPGKNYSPGHMHLRKSAVVNAHILAYICLRCAHSPDAAMPQPAPGGGGRIVLLPTGQMLYLYQYLLHSSHRVLEDQKNASARYRLRRAEIDDALERGAIFPWAALTRLQAPKFFSDMVESLIGAVYLDSRGNLEAARGVMRRLGILDILERIVRADMDVLHPVSRLSLWAGKREKELEYVFEKKKGNVACVIMVDGKEEVRVTDAYRGHASQEEVKFAAAEEAIKLFRLRDVDVNYALLKKKVPRPKKKAEKKAEKMVEA